MIERQQMARMVNVDPSDRNQTRISSFQLEAIEFTDVAAVAPQAKRTGCYPAGRAARPRPDALHTKGTGRRLAERTMRPTATGKEIASLRSLDHVVNSAPSARRVAHRHG